MGIAHKITELDHINAYFVNKTKMAILSILGFKKKMDPVTCVCVHVYAHVHDIGVPLYVCVALECI